MYGIRFIGILWFIIWLVPGCASGQSLKAGQIINQAEGRGEGGAEGPGESGSETGSEGRKQKKKRKKRTRKQAPQPSETALYRDARRKMQGRNYQAAIESFQQLEALYPFGRYAERAQLEIIYAYYSARDLEEARSAADRFIHLHPQHTNTDYAQYLKGLSGFAEGQRFQELSGAKAMLRRDLSPLRDSFTDFKELLELYPDSKYAPDAHKRMTFIRNTMAKQELLIGHYYLDRRAYIAAANRGRYVVENYSQTPAVEDALALMVDAYTFMELDDLAIDTAKVLLANYPDHKNFSRTGAYRAAFPKRTVPRSTLNIVSFGLLARPRVPKPIIIASEKIKTSPSSRIGIKRKREKPLQEEPIVSNEESIAGESEISAEPDNLQE